jgi:hypothetical protein
MDRQRIEFDEKGIKVYTNNGLIEGNGKATHTTISGEFVMSADNLVRLLAHLSESTYIRKVSRFFLPEDWMIKTSNEEVKTFINGLIENEKIKESQISKLEERCNHLLKLIEDHNRGCVGLFHKKIKL